MADEFTGTGVALVTPFDHNLELDLDGLARVLDHTAEADYWVINGTTGESPVLTEMERNQILEFVTGNNPLHLPIMYGIGGNNTKAVVEQIRHTDFSNIQALLSVCPYYNKPTQQGLIRHYSMIADQCPVPVYVYNVPGRTSCNIEADTVLSLSEHPNIHGVKEASPDPRQWDAIGSNKPNDFKLISGDDISTVSIIKAGGCGVISVMANAFPGLMRSMVQFALKDMWYEAEGVLEVLTPINPLMYRESSPVGVKQALHQLGVCEPYVRLPLVEASSELQKQIAAAFPSTQMETKNPD